jgi:hypothetical protein
MFGTLRIGVIKRNFCLSLQEIDVAGDNGCLKLGNGMVGESGGSYHIGEALIPYNNDFTPENSGL